MIVHLLLAGAGLALLTWAADHLIAAASRLGRQLRISPVAVGVVVIGLGTSMPEFLVSGLAAARGDVGLAVGNLVGSNILNLSLLLGVAAVIAPVPVAASVLRREVPLAVGAVLLFGVLALSGLGVAAAVVLAAACVAALWLLVRWARVQPPAPLSAAPLSPASPSPASPSPASPSPAPPSPASPSAAPLSAASLSAASPSAASPSAAPPSAVDARPADGIPSARKRRWVTPVRALLGLAGVLAGAQMLVSGAAGAAAEAGVSQAVVGFTLVAVGTSLPELVTTVQAQRRGESDLVIGNLFGSNLFNSLAGGSVVGFADSAGPARGGVVLVAVMVAGALLAGLLLVPGRRLARAHGVLLGLAYLATVPLLLSA